MTQRYAPGEITLPSNLSESYADWVAVSWDTRISLIGRPARVVFIQYLLAPGVLVYRQREKVGTHLFTPGATPRPFECLQATIDDGPGDASSETSSDIAEKTMTTLFSNSTWQVDELRSPYVVNFNDDAEVYPTSPFTKKDFLSLPSEDFRFQPVKTLGDVLLHGEDHVVGLVFDRVASARVRAGKS